MNYIAELLKNDRSTYPPSQKGQKGQKNAPTVAHRWQSAATQPDARELLAAVKAATRGAWLTPQPALMTVWRAFDAHFTTKFTSQQIGAIARLIEENPQLDNDELLTQIGALVRMENPTL